MSNHERQSAYRHGKAAAEAGDPATDNPYKDNSMRRAWNEGWNAGAPVSVVEGQEHDDRTSEEAQESAKVEESLAALERGDATVKEIKEGPFPVEEAPNHTAPPSGDDELKLVPDGQEELQTVDKAGQPVPAKPVAKTVKPVKADTPPVKRTGRRVKDQPQA